MTTVSSPSVNRSMSDRELRVFDEWSTRSVQTGSSAPGFYSQAQGQTGRRVSGQTQPQANQAHIPHQNQGQPSGRRPINTNAVGNLSVSDNASSQRKPSQGRSQGYGSNNVNTGSFKGNNTALVVPSGPMPHIQAPNRGRSQYQGYGSANTNAGDKPMSVTLNRHVNPNASLPRQALPNQILVQGQGWAAETHGSMSSNINARVNSNANSGAQMQTQNKARGQSLRQGQGYDMGSAVTSANINGSPSVQTSQTTHRRHNIGRNKHRDRGPTVFDEWKAQATREDAANREKGKHDEPIAATTASMPDSNDKLKDVMNEWMVGAANPEKHTGVGESNASSNTKAAISGAQVDAIGTGSSPAKLLNQLDCPEGSKGRSGKRRGRKNSGGGRRNRGGSGSGENKANEKKSTPGRSRRRERAGFSGSKVNLKVDAPVDSASLSATPSVDIYTSNAAAGPKEETNDLQKKDTAKTRSNKSSFFFSSGGPERATIGENNVSPGGMEIGISSINASSPPQPTDPVQPSSVDGQKKLELESKPDGKECNMCEGSKNIPVESDVTASASVPAGAPRSSSPTSCLVHLKIDQAQKDNVSQQPEASKVSCSLQTSSVSAATENETSTPVSTELPATSETLVRVTSQKKRQSALNSASEVGQNGMLQGEQKPTRPRQRYTGSASPGKSKPEHLPSI